MKAKQDYARRRRQALTNGEFAEVLVERDENPPIADGALSDLSVGASARVRVDPSHVVPALTERFHRVTGDVLVRQYPHLDSVSQRIDSFGVQNITRVLQASLDVVMGQAGIVTEDCLLSPSLRQQVYDELDRQPGSFHDRLARQNLRVEVNSIFPVLYRHLLLGIDRYDLGLPGTLDGVEGAAAADCRDGSR